MLYAAFAHYVYMTLFILLWFEQYPVSEAYLQDISELDLLPLPDIWLS